jgi:hypothetical protein
MKDRIVVGITLGLAYLCFVWTIPHDSVGRQGMETDFVTMYVLAASQFSNMIGRDDGIDWGLNHDVFAIHGIGYAAILAIGGWIFDDKDSVPGWEYFVVGKWVSRIAAAAVIAIAVIWLGLLPGILSAVVLALNSMFFELAYSCCTDMVALALALWGVYALVKKQPLVGGLLYGLLCCFRYEYMIFLPFLGWYCWGKDMGWWKFFAPILLMVVVNLSISGFSDALYSNTLQHYLNDEKLPDYHYYDMAEKYPTIVSVLLADPINTLRIFIQDVGYVFQNIGVSQVWGVLFFGALFMLVKMPAQLRWGLLAHFFIIAFTAYRWGTVRYFFPEIVVLIFLGALWIGTQWDMLAFQRWKRWLILVALLPTMIIVWQNVDYKIDSLCDEMYLPPVEMARILQKDDVVMSVYPRFPYVVGCRWLHWDVDYNVVDPELWEEVNYLLFDAMANVRRPKWKERFSTSKYVREYFDVYYVWSETVDDEGRLLGILCKLKQ